MQTEALSLVRRTVIAVLFCGCCGVLQAQQKASSDSIGRERVPVNAAHPQLSLTDSIKADTLREVVVSNKRKVSFPLNSTMMKEVTFMTKFRQSSLGGWLQKYYPIVNDWITHPFGFAERKRNKKRKKVKHILEQYDAISAVDPLQLLLDSVATALKEKE